VTTFFMLCFLLFLAAGLCTAVAATLCAHISNRRAAAARWLDAARHESWDLGLPFPEADGTLSQPPVATPPELRSPKRPTGEQVAEVLHGRRIAAESKTFLVKEAVAIGLSHREAERMSRAALIKYVRVFDNDVVIAAAQWNETVRDRLREVATSQQVPPTALGESD
jgi:hypothetical protein